MVSGETLKRHQAHYRGDSSEWQRNARLLQSLWRERQGLPPGGERDYDGSYLAAECQIRESASAYISDGAKAAVRSALASKESGAVMQPNRLWFNLLSSQPLCFNLFGELSEKVNDPRVSRALSRVWPDIATVTCIRYEWSPGRKDPRFLGNGTAFDVYIEYISVDESARFLGIEVKYHEDLAVKAPTCGARPEEVFHTSKAFADGSFATMSTGKNAQILLDHLLALSINQDPGSGAHRVVRLALPEAQHGCGRGNPVVLAQRRRPDVHPHDARGSGRRAPGRVRRALGR